MNDKKEEFFGVADLTEKIYFNVKSEDREKAKKMVFNDIKNNIKDIEVILKDGSTLDISKIDCELTFTVQRKADFK